MIAKAQHRTPQTFLSVDDYIAWSLSHDGPRADLIDGVVYAHASQRLIHIQLKVKIVNALADGLKRAGLACEAVGDGAVVRISNKTAFEPDALVYCGPKLSRMAVEVPNPVIVVEVLSPDSQKRDQHTKLQGYFQLASIAHYLIVDPDEEVIIHHAGRASDARLSQVVREGSLLLDPPGLALDVADVFAA